MLSRSCYYGIMSVDLITCMGIKTGNAFQGHVGYAIMCMLDENSHGAVRDEGASLFVCV